MILNEKTSSKAMQACLVVVIGFAIGFDPYRIKFNMAHQAFHKIKRGICPVF